MLTNGQSFHDASLVAIDRSQDDLTLSFENIYADGTLRSAELKLLGITEILCDDSPIDKLELLEDDGEVLDLSEEAGALSMTVAWINFKQDTETTHSYRIACRSIETMIGAVSPDSPIGN